MNAMRRERKERMTEPEWGDITFSTHDIWQAKEELAFWDCNLQEILLCIREQGDDK